MRPLALLLAVLMGVAAADPARAEVITVVQETRTREKGRKIVQHSAIFKNAGDRPVRGLRVTVELYDYFGALLWARTTSPAPSSLRPGETATLSIPTPDLADHRRTAYRFEYQHP